MKWIDYIRKLLGGQRTESETPDGYCPNCWGEQQYEGKFRDVLMKEHIDLNNVEENLGWIEAYVIEHFEGVQLKNENGRKVCHSCHRSL